MRYLFIALAALLLFAAPAFADIPAGPIGVDVDVNIDYLYNEFTFYTPDITFEPAATDLASPGEMTQAGVFYADDVSTNFPFTVKASFAGYTGDYAGLHISLQDANDAGWVELSTTAQEILQAGPGELMDLAMDIKLSGLTWATPPGHPTAVLTLTWVV